MKRVDCTSSMSDDSLHSLHQCPGMFTGVYCRLLCLLLIACWKSNHLQLMLCNLIKPEKSEIRKNLDAVLYLYESITVL